MVKKIGLAILGLFIAASAQAGTLTPLGFSKYDTGDTDWVQQQNDNMDLAEQEIAGLRASSDTAGAEIVALSLSTEANHQDILANDAELAQIGIDTMTLQGQIDTNDSELAQIGIDTMTLQGQIDTNDSELAQIGIDTMTLQGQIDTNDSELVAVGVATAATQAALEAGFFQIGVDTAALQVALDAGFFDVGVDTDALQALIDTNISEIFSLSASTEALQVEMDAGFLQVGIDTDTIQVLIDTNIIEIADLTASTIAIELAKLDRAGDTMTGTLNLTGFDSYINTVSSINTSGVFAESGFFNGTVTATNLVGDGSGITGVGTSTATNVTLLGKVGEAGGVSKGQCVYQSGATGFTPQYSLVDNTDSGKHEFVGIAAHDAALNASLLVRVIGQLTSVDTDGTGVPGGAESWNDNDTLYCIAGGLLSNVRPISGTVEEIGKVAYAHGVLGKITVYRHSAHYAAVPSGEDYDVRLGDSIGGTKLAIENYVDETVVSIDSQGQQVWNPDSVTASTIAADGSLHIGATADSHFSAQVGIGTTAPDKSLHIVGNMKFPIDVYPPTTFIDYHGDMAFRTGGVRNNFIRRAGITYFNGGDVGIGITAPEAKLHVVGDSTFTGTVFAQNFDTLESEYRVHGVAVIDANRNVYANNIFTDNGIDISVLDTSTAANRTDIDLNAGEIVDLVASTVANRTDIDLNAGEIIDLIASTSANAGNITTVEGTANDNATEIVNLIASTTSNRTDIDINSGDITIVEGTANDNATEVAALIASTESNKTDIDQNTTDIGTNDTEIAALGVSTDSLDTAKFDKTGGAISGDVNLGANADLSLIGPTGYVTTQSSVNASSFWASGVELGAGGGTGHTISTGPETGPWEDFPARDNLNFDSDYFVLVDSPTGNGTHVTLPTGTGQTEEDVWAEIDSQIASAGASVSLSLDGAGEYQIVGAWEMSAFAHLYLRFDSDSSGTNYAYNVGGLSNAADQIQLTNNVLKTDSPQSVTIWFEDEGSEMVTRHLGGGFNSANNFERFNGAGKYDAGVASTVQILPASGNFTGTFKLLKLQPATVRTAAISVPASSSTYVPTSIINENNFSLCKATVQVIVVADAPLEFVVSGMMENNSLQTSGWSVLMDGEFLPGWDDNRMMAGVKIPASSCMNLSAVVDIPAVAAGTHDFCITFAGENATNLKIISDAATCSGTSSHTGMFKFGVRQPRNTAGTGDMASSAALQTLTGKLYVEGDFEARANSCYVVFTGTGTVAKQWDKPAGCASVSDISAGVYELAFTTPWSDAAAYVCNPMTDANGSNILTAQTMYNVAPTASAYRLHTYNISGTDTDSNKVRVSCYGDQ